LAFTLLDPWQGYWVKAKVACELILTPPDQSPARVPTEAGKGGWTVELMAQSGSERANCWLGVLPPETGRQGLQVSPPPDAPEGRRLHLSLLPTDRRPEGALALDLRPRMGFPTVWPLLVQTERSDTEVVLTWPNLGSVPPQVKLTLVDESTGRRQAMRTTSAYRFRTGRTGEARPFRIEADHRVDPGLTITAFTAQPTRGGINLTFSLSRAAQADVSAYTLNGRHVASPYRARTCRAGLNNLGWDLRDGEGRPLPNGEYLCRITVRTEDGEMAQATQAVTVRR